MDKISKCNNKKSNLIEILVSFFFLYLSLLCLSKVLIFVIWSIEFFIESTTSLLILCLRCCSIGSSNLVVESNLVSLTICLKQTNRVIAPQSTNLNLSHFLSETGLTWFLFSFRSLFSSSFCSLDTSLLLSHILYQTFFRTIRSYFNSLSLSPSPLQLHLDIKFTKLSNHDRNYSYHRQHYRISTRFWSRWYLIRFVSPSYLFPLAFPSGFHSP